MKITINATSTSLKFFPNTIFRFNFNSPIIGADGSFSFPFDIPAQDNAAALGYANNINLQDVQPEYFDVIIDSKYISTKTAKLYIEPNNKTFSCSLIVEDGFFNSKIQNQNLQQLVDIDIDMGADIDAFITSANTDIAKSFPEVKFKFPVIYNSDPYDDPQIAKLFKFINYYNWSAATPTFIKNIIFSVLIPNEPYEPGNFSSYIPCPFVFEIISNIIQKINLNPTGEALTNTFINQLLFITTKTIDKSPDIDIDYIVKAKVFDIGGTIMRTDRPLTIAEVILDNLNTWLFDEVNFFNYYLYPRNTDAVMQFRCKFQITSNWATDKEIYFSVKEVYTIGHIYQIDADSNIVKHTVPAGGTINIEFVINALCSENDNFRIWVLSEDTIYDGSNTLILDIDSTLDILPISDMMMIKTNTQFNLKNHLPEISVAQLFEDLKHMFGLFPFTDNNQVHLKLFKDIFNSAPEIDLSEYLSQAFSAQDSEKIKSISFPDATDLEEFEYQLSNDLSYSAEPKLIRLHQGIAHFYINNYDDLFNFAWERLKPYRSILKIKDKGNELAISAQPSQMQSVNPGYPATGNWTNAPRLNDKLNSPHNSEPSTDYYLAFWRGMINDSGSKSFPLASSTIYQGNSTVLSNTVNLQFEGAKGLYENFLKELLTTINKHNNILQIDAQIPDNILMQLTLFNTYIAAGIKFIILSKDFEIDTNDNIIQPVTLTMLKL